MRISDWSSDVCSSDLAARPRLARALRLAADAGRRRPCGARLCRLWRGLYRRGAAVAVGGRGREARPLGSGRSEEHTSELQSLMRISYAVFSLIKKTMSHSLLLLPTPLLDYTTVSIASH